MQDYRKLSVWGKAHELTLFTYRITAGYPREEIYALVQHYQYLLSKDLSYISTQEYETVTLKIREIRAMLISLANRIRQQNSILNTHNS